MTDSSATRPTDEAAGREPDLSDELIADELVTADADESERTPFVPSDNTTLTSVINGLADEGFTASLTPQPEGVLRCSACEAESPADAFEVAGVRRLEGASDPDDMISVASAHCPRCGAGGVAVLGYGPTASATDTDVMFRLNLPRNGG